MMFADLPKEAVDEFVALTGPDSDCPLVSVEIRQLGGAMDREPSAPNAVPTRGLPYVMFAFGVGGPGQEDLMRGYLAKLISGLKPWSADRMMANFMSPDEATAPAQLSPMPATSGSTCLHRDAAGGDDGSAYAPLVTGSCSSRMT